MSTSIRNAARRSDERDPIAVTAELLRGWPLPQPGEDADKDERGSVLVAGGALGLPGAVILAATAALRAGAGKLRIATGRSIVPLVAVAVPEAAVFGLPETPAGSIDSAAAGEIASRAGSVQALLVGPGMADDQGTKHLMELLVPQLGHTALVLDAGALAVVGDHPEILHNLAGNVILTPHAGEMASMVGADKTSILRNPQAFARQGAERWQAVVALKGARTYIAAEGPVYCFSDGSVGLATSGSGDTLAGLVAGLVARGAPPLQAAAWGVYLHGTAGARLAKRMGPLGFLARELLAEVPALMADPEAVP